MRRAGRLWAWVVLLAVLSPLGLILPAYFHAGGAWGEWSDQELKELVGYIPSGLAKVSSLWHSPFPRYSVPTGGQGAFGTVLAALAGVAATATVALLIGRHLTRKGG